uniref:Uncharacterized protein n=1 Tax=Monodelphis domestica TaxID=13616 RepID=K7E232_MONDO
MADSLSYRDPISSSVGRRMIFTGPEAKKDYKPKIPLYTKYIGEKSPVLETTTELDYLWRPAPNKNFIAREKHFYVGEIGWGIPALSYTNDSRLQTGWNKKQGEFHKAAEDLLSHRYQNPWYPNPQILDLQGASRSYLAWNIGDHENISERHSKWANIVRNLKSMRYSNCSSISKVDQKINLTLLITRSSQIFSFMDISGHFCGGGLSLKDYRLLQVTLSPKSSIIKVLWRIPRFKNPIAHKPNRFLEKKMPRKPHSP